MKLIPVTYQGFTAMDRRFSSPMLPWIVSEIRKRNHSEKLSLGVEECILQAYNPDFELQFAHKVSQMTRFSQADLDPCTFLYLLRDDHESLLYCYLFQAKKPDDVTDLYKQMKEQNQSTPTPTRSASSAANLTSLCVDISPSSSNFFEVLYIGKIKVWHRKVPETFIDDALEKFKIHELEKHKAKQLGNIGKLLSETDLRRGDSEDSVTNGSNHEVNNSSPGVTAILQRSQSCHSNLLTRSVHQNQHIEVVKEDEEVKSIASTVSASDGELNNNVEEIKSSVNLDDHNRTMVLQVDRTDLRLISPDRKVILLHKHHRDVTTCVQGQINQKHFGFICKEGSNTQNYIGYIFKCESSSIANEACVAITQAVLNAESRPRPTITSCEHCPMVWFHKLCVEIENMSDRKTQAAILRKIEHEDEDEYQIILTKFRGAETDSVREQNEFLMMLLRAHCEMKQGRHVHDTAENRSEFLNQYLGGSTIFTKAKKSLTNSFDQLLKRKGSRDDFSASLKGLSLPIHSSLNKECSPISPAPSIPDVSDRESEGTRSRSSTIGSQNDLKDHLTVNDSQKNSISPERSMSVEKGPKSPMMDIFMKVGNSPKNSTSDDGGSPQNADGGSWRQAIFRKVSTPKRPDNFEELSRKRTKEELRALWKKSIYQAILLVRMEKENANIRAKQEESAVKRIKLEYDEMKPTQREVMDVWEIVTNKENDRMRYDNQMLLHAIRQGVPRGKRGEVWQFLSEKYCSKVAPIDTSKYPSYNVPYDTLLKQLTSHQHAILIDLGRTFPNHSYFSSPLGPGQLALFNLLKAYSLLDPEVGYCQGLSFVAGVLLLHMEEHQAFLLLRHLMFRRGMRFQYLPDMVSLQIKLYQLSRLLHDQLPELYDHFDVHEVAPTLYAAPWLLTVFASQFPLGFVTRVFDLIFLEGPDIIFRVALALLSHHKDKLLRFDSFEEIMNYLKNDLPNIDKPTLDKIMKQVYTTDITKQLNEYKVEYQVLQEEMASVKPHVETIHKLEAQNKILTEQNKSLIAQLEVSLGNVQRLEKIRVFQQSQVNRLEMQSRALDVTIMTLGSFIGDLIEQKKDIDIPDDVQRILSQIRLTERRKNEFKPQQNNVLKMFQKSSDVHPDKPMIKSLSTGKINLPMSVIDQSVFRTNSLNTQMTNNPPSLKNQHSPSNSSEKISKFFSTSHSNILQQKVNSQPILGPKIDIKVQDFETDTDSNKSECNRIPKTTEIEHDKVSPTSSIDSGVGTPLSPKSIVAHPLSNCDVNFTFNGSRELQNLKNFKNVTKNGTANIASK